MKICFVTLFLKKQFCKHKEFFRKIFKINQEISNRKYDFLIIFQERNQGQPKWPCRAIQSGPHDPPNGVHSGHPTRPSWRHPMQASRATNSIIRLKTGSKAYCKYSLLFRGVAGSTERVCSKWENARGAFSKNLLKIFGKSTPCSKQNVNSVYFLGLKR